MCVGGFNIKHDSNHYLLLIEQSTSIYKIFIADLQLSDIRLPITDCTICWNNTMYSQSISRNRYMD
jgi:hypothetical protein